VPGAYDIKTEIIVKRRVSVTGSPSNMPLINAEDASRAFRVKVSQGLMLLDRRGGTSLMTTFSLHSPVASWRSST
jgi:hypothetical protein